MSFFKKLGRKAGGRLSSKVDAKSLDIQEGAHEKAVPTDQDKRSGGASNGRRGDKTPGEGSIHSSTPAQTVNISGGTFNEVQNQYIINAESDNKLFATLNPIPAAHDCQEVASKVTECFAGTRRQLLLDIEKWRTTESSVPIFILDGIAGIGKTTVVKTICARAAADHRLAASWFFSRDQQDRKSTRAFVGTLAFQLSKYHPSFRDRIAQALKDQPDILQKTIRAQFDTLVDEPLQAMLTEVVGTHTISIDAIDECDLNEATEILSILLTMIPKHPQFDSSLLAAQSVPFDCSSKNIGVLTSSTYMRSKILSSRQTYAFTSTTASLRSKWMKLS
ncbi:hypothetical protein BKA70DRAFT_1163736 [Coprinopsis sp. MPI-PUGE-AT-0042]|nr:hypothetical protein BKA70DRAFT_1163736 [Coprinopsis sp. MPI-PUGE-AT-0042]